MVECCCDIVCPRDIECTMHFKLNRLEQYAEFVRDKNLNLSKVIKKIAFVFNKDLAQSQEAFWWSDILEWEWADVPPHATMRWRSSCLSENFFGLYQKSYLAAATTTTTVLFQKMSLFMMPIVEPLVMRFNYEHFE